MVHGSDWNTSSWNRITQLIFEIRNNYIPWYCSSTLLNWIVFVQRYAHGLHFVAFFCGLWSMDFTPILKSTDSKTPEPRQSYDCTMCRWRNPEEYAWVNGSHSLQWRHNGHDSVSNHQPHGCFLNRLFRRRLKKTSKLRVTGLCAGNSPGTGEFSAQMASNADIFSIWWRHHVKPMATNDIRIETKRNKIICKFTAILSADYHSHSTDNRLRKTHKNVAKAV